MKHRKIDQDDILEDETRDPDLGPALSRQQLEQELAAQKAFATRIIARQSLVIVVISLITQIILSNVTEWWVPGKILMIVFLPVCSLSLLLQILLIIQPDLARLKAARRIFTGLESIVCATLSSWWCVWGDQLIALIILISFVIKNVYFTREVFIPKPEPIVSIAASVYREAPKPKFMGSSATIIFVQFVSLLLLGFAKEHENDENFVWFGAVMQFLTILHWVYLLKLGYQFKIHSFLGYCFAFADMCVIMGFYDDDIEKVFGTNKINIIFMFLLFLYSTVKCITILKNIYTFETTSTFLANFSFLPRFLYNYRSYLIFSVLLLGGTFVFRAIYPATLENSPTFLGIQLLVILLLRIYPTGPKNNFIWILGLLSLVITDSYFLATCLSFFEYNDFSQALVMLYILMKDFAMVREFFVIEGDYVFPAMTKKYQKRILIPLFVEILVIIFCFLVEDTIIPAQWRFSEESNYLMASITLVIFILYELMLAPFLGSKKPINIIFAITYRIAEPYTIWALCSLADALDMNLLIYLFVATSLLKNISLASIIENEDVILVHPDSKLILRDYTGTMNLQS